MDYHRPVTSSSFNIIEFLYDLAARGEAVTLVGEQLSYHVREGEVNPQTVNILRQHKAAVVDWLHEREATQGCYPLTQGQLGLWLDSQRNPSSTAYNLVTVARLHVGTQIDRLRQAAQLLLDRHPTLRTIYPLVDDQPQQQVQAQQTLTFTLVDGTGWTQAQIDGWIEAESARPFDLACGPLMRMCILQTYDDRGRSCPLLHWAIHHIATDHFTQEILQEELLTCYRILLQGKQPMLPTSALTYRDFVRWEQDRLQADEAHLATFWQTQLGDSPLLLNLPMRPAASAQQNSTQAEPSKTLTFRLDVALATQLRTTASAHQTTLYTLLLAAYQVLISRYTGQDTFFIISPTAVRDLPGWARIVGYLVNPILLRADLSGDVSFATLLQRTQQTVTAALTHHLYPYHAMLRHWHKQIAAEQLHQGMVGFVFDPIRQHPTDADLFATILSAGQRAMPEPLTLFLFESHERLDGCITYHANRFDTAFTERMLGHFQTLLQGIVDNPDQLIRRLPILTKAERHQLLVEWNDTDTDYPKDKCIHQLFEEQVERTPDAVSVVFDAGCKMQDVTCNLQPASLTYAELNARANQLAHHLQMLGVGPDVLVGLCVERSIEMVVGLLGILKAGGAYVPLDPTYPHERLAFMLEDTATPLILTQARLRPDLPSVVATLCLDTEWEAIAGYPTCNLSANVSTENLAYVMYTSGSTGHPKGVCTIQRNVVRLVQNTNFMRITADEVMMQLAPMSFDAATLEFWAALLNGGRLVIMSPDQPSLQMIGAAIRQYGVTTLLLTTGLLHLMVDENVHALRPLRQLLTGGDVLSVTHVRHFLQAVPDCQLINGYGPTENTTYTCCYPFPVGTTIGTSAPIGGPIANTQVFVLDQHLQPVPIGVPGELYAGGDGLARGYLNRPELTVEKFIVNPFGAGTIYKTGDLVRWLPDGTIEFLGRIDQQVKIHGFRIELGEIEAVLSQHPDVQEAAVIAREDRPGEKRLVAYVVQRCKVARSQSEETDPAILQFCNSATLRSYLQAKLPDYMVPSAFVLLDVLPITPNGKVDRNALPALDLSAMSSQQTFVPPRTPTERAIADVWSAVLGVEQIGIHDNFFDLGGHSLLAMQVISRIRQAVAVDLPLRQLFQTPTIVGLASYLENAQLLQTMRPTAKTEKTRLGNIRRRL